MLRRKIDEFLKEWKSNPNKSPLIVRGARQIGKTESIRQFARTEYKHFVEINFVLQKQYRDIFDEGYEVEAIVQNLSFKNPDFQFEPYETLIFFDELQACPDCATSLKSFKLDGRYDVICSGSLMGISYREIESNSVGFKEDYEMQSMDFEEFLWAKHYRDEQVEGLFSHMAEVSPLSTSELQAMFACFEEYMVVGGMPHVVDTYVQQKHFGGILKMQQQILQDYEEDMTKYAGGLDQTKILNVFRKVPVFLGNENKKFQISKVAKGARNREYVGVVDWLERAGVVNVCYCMQQPQLPMKGNYNPDLYKLYLPDTGLLVASLDDEVQEDLRNHKNFNTYKGALYENVMGEMLAKQGCSLLYYRNEKSTLEMDFLVRDKDSLVPVEVKARDGATISLRNMIQKDSYPDTHYGIKFGYKNIGFNGQFYTFPYFLGFLLKRFLREMKNV